MSINSSENLGPLNRRIAVAQGQQQPAHPDLSTQIESHLKQTGQMPSSEAITWSTQTGLPLSEAPGHLSGLKKTK